ncbi:MULTISPECIES: hypothetical protein [Agrobacterium]|uniref:Cold-shock protein n=1 Tax=Agrobacterium larrymoorei TaxID=160699 RepID=A0AAJ2BDD4_9HYPH|nr:hypothetical protein [Agrobacterium larrymoorei]MDQ1185569.1 hypothetical protein [Agrobacterium larrymoorei]MDQ1198048.1 hypothetical protein [Rhizobium sp. SORGH_AS_0787]MDR6104683.1 hypothetical protein [Agrobacterium larrymoorei]
MPKMSYKTGNVIVLKSRTNGDPTSQQSARIIAAMPETTQGSRRYRIRLDGENFDRTVSQDDIDLAATAKQKPDTAATKVSKPGGWINHDLVRTRK